MKNQVLNFNIDNTYEKLPPLFYAKVKPYSFPSAHSILFNSPLAEALGLILPNDDQGPLHSKVTLADLGTGNWPLGASAIAMAYAGHQYGHFNILGDGRALLFAEHLTPSGQRFDIQLKGSGPTPYSRRGDGMATLGPMLREYIISEAMYALGVPTTRSLGVYLTGQTVLRDQYQAGAVLIRVGASHLRIGTLQLGAYHSLESLKAIVDYTINRHYPSSLKEPNPVLAFFQTICKHYAHLVAQWLGFGFVHGVLNTDNMALSGETIDYGPCAFMDGYSKGATFSSIDHYGRYAYNQQSSIVGWNLARLGECLLPLIDQDQNRAIAAVEATLNTYSTEFEKQWQKHFAQKIGLENAAPKLVQVLLQIMQDHSLDFTYTFAQLTLLASGKLSNDHKLPSVLESFIEEWQPLITPKSGPLMQTVNPIIIPRNSEVEASLYAAVNQENYEPLLSLLDSIQHPFDYSQKQIQKALPPQKMNRPYVTYCGT